MTFWFGTWQDDGGDVRILRIQLRLFRRWLTLTWAFDFRLD